MSAPKPYITRQKDAIVRISIVEKLGDAIGLKVEISNPVSDKDMMLVVRDNIGEMFTFEIKNAQGDNVAPFPTVLAIVHPENKKDAGYCDARVLPGTSQSWFIDLPNQQQLDLLNNSNNNNLGPLENGTYAITLNVMVGYTVVPTKEDLPTVSKEITWKKIDVTTPAFNRTVVKKLESVSTFQTYFEETKSLQGQKHPIGQLPDKIAETPSKDTPLAPDVPNDKKSNGTSSAPDSTISPSRLQFSPITWLLLAMCIGLLTTVIAIGYRHVRLRKEIAVLKQRVGS